MYFQAPQAASAPSCSRPPPVPFHPVYLVQSYSIFSNPTKSNPIEFSQIKANPIQIHPPQPNPNQIQKFTIQLNPVQQNKTKQNALQLNSAKQQNSTEHKIKKTQKKRLQNQPPFSFLINKLHDIQSNFNPLSHHLVSIKHPDPTRSKTPSCLLACLLASSYPQPHIQAYKHTNAPTRYDTIQHNTIESNAPPSPSQTGTTHSSAQGRARQAVS